MIEFRHAVRGQTPLIIGIAGPSGSGKSLSSLRLATGLAGDKRVVLVNTEGARGHLYADEYPVLTYDMDAPFSLERYREAIDAAVKLDPGCLVIDQVSSGHEGPGGQLDQHEAILDRLAGDDYKKRERMTWAAWVKPKADESLMIGALTRANCHIVLCLRAKEKLKIVRGKDPEPLGWQPICSDRMSFETTITFVLPPGSEGRPDFKELGAKHRKPLMPILQEITQLDEETGRKLAAWAAGAAPANTVDHEGALKDAPSLEALKAAYEAIPEAQRTTYNALTARRKSVLQAQEGSRQESGQPTLRDALAALKRKDFETAMLIALALAPDEAATVQAEVDTARAA